MTAARRILIAATDGGVLKLFVPLAHKLRERGFEVRFFTTFLRDRLLLERIGERVVAGTANGGSEAALPRSLERAIDLRARVGGIRSGRRLRRHASAVHRAAIAAVADTGLVVVWNGGELQAAAVAEAARSANKPLWFCENGLLPGTMQCDPEGVNAASRAARARPLHWRAGPALRSLPETGPPWRPYDAPRLAWRAGVTLVEWIEALCLPWRARHAIPERLRHFRGKRLRNRPLVGDARPLPPRFVFVPLQVHDDTQILDHGGWVDSMDTLCAALRAAACDLPIVVRQHPMDLGRSDQEQLESRYPEFLWTRTRDLRACLEAATVVVTVNSTVGMEALALGRPIVVCGAAVFGEAAVADLAPTATDLAGAIRSAVQRGMASPSSRLLLGWLQSNLHVVIDRHRPDEASLERLADRIDPTPVSERPKGVAMTAQPRGGDRKVIAAAVVLATAAIIATAAIAAR